MEFLNDMLGVDAVKLTALNMSSRAVFVFIASFFFMRVAGLRTFGKKTIFDQATLLMTGSMLGRSIVSDSPFYPSMLAVLVVVMLHRLISFINLKSKSARNVIMGKPIKLFHSGKFLRDNMAKLNITEDDIYEAIRTNTQTEDLKEIKESYLEPSGEISLIKK